MKKLISVFVVFVTVLSLFSLQIVADDKKKIDYGTDEIELTIVDLFGGENQTVAGYADLGYATISNGKIVMETNAGMFDAYSIRTQSMATINWEGKKYIVFELSNTSDGDVYFCFQPSAIGKGSTFLSSQLAAESPVLLYNVSKNECKNAKWSGVQMVNNRDALIIPWHFEGYVFIPLCIIANLNDLMTPVLSDEICITEYGFHLKPDDATTVTVTISAIYASEDLPSFTAPEKITEAPTELPTEAPTEITTETVTERETEAETKDEEITSITETEFVTEQRTEQGTETPQYNTNTESQSVNDHSGCTSIIASSISLWILMWITSAYIFKKKQ